MYNKPFWIIKRKSQDNLFYYTWKIKTFDFLNQLDDDVEQLFVVPFSQAKERKFEVIENNEKIISIIINEKKELFQEDFFKTFEEKSSDLDWNTKDFYTKEEYEKIVADIIEKEIWNWEWSNFVIPQKISWKIKNFSVEVALSIFKRLLLSDYWVHMTFIFFDWEKYFIWASPERNVSIEKKWNENIVRMNPIAGTFRKWKYKNFSSFKKDFVPFLDNKKEIDELFMVVDEELKMMSHVCSSWWMIVWPILKEMANLIHTEYLLNWKTNMNKIDVFRESMWAPTVVWSPLESAFRTVTKYEKESRSYYAGAICYMNEKELDSAILFRTIEVEKEWKFDARVWTTIVKRSIPEDEYKETVSKLSWVLNAIAWETKPSRKFLWDFYLDDEIQERMQIRNQDLSKTWFFKQDVQIDEKLEWKKVLIINNEDDFTNMLAHLLRLLWLEVEIKRFDSPHLTSPKGRGIKGFENYDLTLIWPWPWNPTENTEKNKINLDIIRYLEENNKKYFWVCLWHQLICRSKNIELKKKEIPTQWEQIEIDLFWKMQKVAFYNTFSWFDKNWKIINALRWENFFSYQFHPESILTQNWLEILRESLEELVKNK